MRTFIIIITIFLYNSVTFAESITLSYANVSFCELCKGDPIVFIDDKKFNGESCALANEVLYSRVSDATSPFLIQVYKDTYGVSIQGEIKTLENDLKCFEIDKIEALPVTRFR